MNLLRPVTEAKQEVRQTKVNQVAGRILKQLVRLQPVTYAERLSFEVGHKTADRGSAGYLAAVAERVTELGGLYVEGWAFDPEASKDASQSPSGDGYGNYQTRVWKDDLTMVYSRVESLAA